MAHCGAGRAPVHREIHKAKRPAEQRVVHHILETRSLRGKDEIEDREHERRVEEKERARKKTREDERGR